MTAQVGGAALYIVGGGADLCILQARVVDIEKERVVFEEIVWVLDKCENDTLPQVQLNQAEVGGH